MFFIALGYGRQHTHRIFHIFRHLEKAAALSALLQPIVVNVEKSKPMKEVFHLLVNWFQKKLPHTILKMVEVAQRGRADSVMHPLGIIRKSKNLSRQVLACMVADKAIGMCDILINVLILIIKTCPLIGNE